MIIIYEPICYTLEHAPVNSAFICILHEAFPSEKIKIVGEATHLEELKDSIPPQLSDIVQWKSIRIASRNEKRFLTLLRYEICIFRLLKKQFEDPFNILFCTSARESTLFLLKTYMRTANVNSFVVMHGYLNKLDGWRSKNPFKKIVDFNSLFLKLNTTKINYVVLEQSIKRFLHDRYPSVAKHILTIDHPLPNEAVENKRKNKLDCIHFGFLGLATEEKGISNFIKLSQIIKQDCFQDARFHVIGRWLKGESGSNEWLDSTPEKCRLSIKDYVDRLVKVDFICFLYEERHYSLSASGALLDAICHGKPMIVSKIPLFTDLFELYGDIGYIYESEKDLSEIVRQIIQKKDLDRYNKQVLNIKKIKADRSIKSLAQKFNSFCALK